MGTRPVTSQLGSLLFGQTRRDVLALLLGRPDERFYLREILRAAGGGSGGVQRELKQLTEAGLLHRVREGRQVYFSANRHAPIFTELQSIIQKTAGAVDILRAALAHLGHQGRIEVAFIHGSVASGTQTAASDVDLLVIGSVTMRELVPALRVAEAGLGREVNAALFPPAEFRTKFTTGAPFLVQVLAGPKLFVVGDDDELGRVARQPVDRGTPSQRR